MSTSIVQQCWDSLADCTFWTVTAVGSTWTYELSLTNLQTRMIAIYLIPLAKAMSKFSTRQYTRQAAIISTIAKYYFIHVASLSHTLALLSTAYMRTDDKGGSKWWRQGWGRGTGTCHVTHHTTSLLHPTAIATRSIARYLAPATCEVTTYLSSMNHL